MVHLRQTGDGLEYQVGGEDGERDDLDLDHHLHDYFRLDDDIEAVYAQLGRHEALARAIGRYPGLRLLRQDPWECLVAYLCSGTNSIRRIKYCVEKHSSIEPSQSSTWTVMNGMSFPAPLKLPNRGRARWRT